VNSWFGAIPVEVITSVQPRRRWSAEEKAAIVQETYAPGMSVSLVARSMFPVIVINIPLVRNQGVRPVRCFRGPLHWDPR
jgi:hypothetical protein